MFWEYGITVSTIDKLLDRDPAPNLDEILNENDLLSEIKANNEKLLNFLSSDSNILAILNHLTTNSKLSKICKDVLTSGAVVLDESILDDYSRLNLIWTHNSEPNIILILDYYILYKTREIFNYFLTENIDFLNIVDSITNNSVCDLLIRLLTIKSDEICKNISRIFIEKDFGVILLNKILSTNPEINFRAFYIVSEYLNFIRNGIANFDGECSEKHMIMTLLNDENINKIIKFIIDNDDTFPAVSLLCVIFNLQRTGESNGDEFINPSNIPLWILNLSKKSFSGIVVNLEPLFNKLKNSTEKSIKLGRVDLLLIEFFVSLTLYNDETLALELTHLDIPLFLMGLFEKYPNHNILHNLIELSISSILLGIRWKTQHGAHLFIDNNLFYSLFKSNLFFEIIVKLSGQKANYIAHVRQIYRSLLKARNDVHHAYLNEKFENLPENLKTLFPKISEIIGQIDQIEIIDNRFLKAMTADLESNYVSENNSYINIERATETFKKEISTYTFEDNLENFEKILEMNENTKNVPHKFDEMKIPSPVIECIEDKSDSILTQIDQIVKSNITENESQDEDDCVVIDTIVKNTIMIPENNSLNVNLLDAKNSNTSLNEISLTRNATSSPLLFNTNKSSIEDSAFDDDSLHNNSNN